jgi:sugar lactone lactonase YvrE
VPIESNCPTARRRRVALLALLALAATAGAAAAQELLYAAEGNRLRRYDLDTLDGEGAPLEELVFENATLDPEHGRDINGTVCALPDGSGRFVAGEDSGQPHPPAGWGVLTPDGRQVGKLTPTALAAVPDPHGCAFDAAGRLFTTETGRQFFGGANGQLMVWFPPFDRFPGAPGEYPHTDATSSGYCKLATDIGTAAGVTVDAEGRVYVAAASGLEVLRFSPPFPTSDDAEGGCGSRDATGAPFADPVQRERFLGSLPRLGMLTYSGLAVAPNGNLYVASVLTGRIAEFDRDGRFVRFVLQPPDWLPPHPTGHPQGLAVDARGTLYYADLELEIDLSGIHPGRDGKVWRIRFDATGAPLAPEIVARGLAFPDGLGVLPGDLEERAARGELRPPPPPAPPAPRPPGSEGRLLALAGALLVLLIAGRLARD